MRAPFAPPRMSVPRKLAAEAQAVRTSSGTVSPESRISRLQLGNVAGVDQRMIDRGDRILPAQRFDRNFRADVAGTRDPCRDGSA